MALKQVELSKRFYKKMQLQKLGDKIISEWKQNPRRHLSLQDLHRRVESICDLPRGWKQQEYDDALQQLESLRQELANSPAISSTIPKLTDLIIAAMNMVNAGAQDKASALIDAFYRVHGFNALEHMYESLGKVVEEEHRRQSLTANLRGFYDPNMIPGTSDTRLPKDSITFT